MKIKTYASTVSGVVKAITSKSYAHRAMICNYYATGKTSIDGVLPSADVRATEACLCAIKNGGVLDAGESGSTLRFLIPVVSAIGGDYTFKLHGKLKDRPNEELFSVLKSHGVKACQTGDLIKISGKLTSGEFLIRGDISSQYITGLMLALPLIKGDSVIVPTTPLVSTPYIDITIDVLKDYGVNVVKKDGKFFIKGEQTFKGNSQVEGDWSNAGFFLVAGAIAGEVTVTGLNKNSKQGDKVIVEVIKSAGATIALTDNAVTVKSARLNPFTFDAEDCPDIVPICAVLGACANGVSTIKNISRLKIKESDRVLSTITLLKALGVDATSDGVDMQIFGNGGNFSGGTVSSFNDHRIAMAGAIAGLKCKNPLIIDGAEAVNKSYPTFFEDYLSCGGKEDDNF